MYGISSRGGAGTSDKPASLQTRLQDANGLNPSISVIIPAYNASSYVGNAIESALAQTYPPIEVIVVDDGSKDNTYETVSRYPAPVKAIRRANGGPAAARNLAAREAKGEWLALLDADDTWLPNKLERQIAWMTRENVGVVHCFRVGEEGSHKVPAQVTFDDLWQRNHVANSSALVRRAAFDAVGGFDEDRALISVEDYNLWLRMAAAGWAIVTCPEGLWRYTPALGNLMSDLEKSAMAEFVNLDKVASLLNLSRDSVQQKRLQLCEEFGRAFFYARNLRRARPLLAAACLKHPSMARLSCYAATFLPPAVINLKRRHSY